MNRLVLGIVAAFVLIPSPTLANCGNDPTCEVGARGQGGESSGGKAQGFNSRGFQSPAIPNSTFTETGNTHAGHITESAGGTLSGGAAPGSDTFHGHGTGLFGDWAGECDFDDFPFCE